MKSYVYLHGFASSSASSKAQYFLKTFADHGVVLRVPDLDGGDFEHLTISKQLDEVAKHASEGPVVLLGSSLGGYLASLYAERHPEVERVVLLAPAFDFRQRWASRFGKKKVEEWKIRGELPIFHFGTKTYRMMGYELFEDAAQYAPYPVVRQPTLVLQGLHDDVVVPETARRFCGNSPNAALRFFESGHELTDVLPELWAAIEPFLFP